MTIKKEWVRKLTERFPILNYVLQFNDGLDIKEQEKAEADPRNYYFGASPLIKKVLQPNGDWSEYFPIDEKQSGRFESMSCTVFAFLNVLEALAKRKYGANWDKSDRFTAKMSGVTRRGNSMNRVLDSARKLHGLLGQDEYPNDIDKLTWNQFYQNVPRHLIVRAKYFLDEFEIGYESVASHPTALKEALKYSPLYVAGYAWHKKGNEYISTRTPNHAFVIQRYDANNPIVRDSYEPFEKRLARNYKIAYPKIIVLKKKNPDFDVPKIQKLLSDGKLYIVRADKNGEWYKVEKDSLKYLPTIPDIAKELTQHLQESPNNINEMITFLSKKGKVKWVSEKEYFDIIN